MPMAMAHILPWLLLLLPNAAAGAGADDTPGIERARLYGNLNAYAYYFADLLVGSPQEQLTSVIIDTGSHMLAFPCGGCDHCGLHLEPAVDISKSQTARWVSCKEQPQSCKSCAAHDRCQYEEKYSEGSSISGHWFKDVVRLGDVAQDNAPVRVQMGCHTSENKLFYTQRANGIMGLAPGSTVMEKSVANILEDLYGDKGHVNTRLFSICLAEWGGLLSVGGSAAEYHTSGVQWIDMAMQGYYVLKPSSMLVEDRLVASSIHDFGQAVVDTGTTLSYFPQMVYDSLVGAIDAYCALPNKCNAERLPGKPHCWKFQGLPKQADFPTIKLKFSDIADPAGIDVHWYPESYLSKKIRVSEYCYAFAPTKEIDQTILGISFLLQKDAIFDVQKGRFAVVEANCPQHHKIPTSLWELLSHPSLLLKTRLSLPLPLLAAGAFVGLGLIGFRAVRAVASVQSQVAPVEPREMRSLL